MEKALDCALDYIEKHIKEDLYIESPSFSGASAFANKVTYWKDTVLIDREDGTPDFPVCYPLAHCIALNGLRELRRAGSMQASRIDRMMASLLRGIKSLWNTDDGTIYCAIDEQGAISAVTSDTLHALYYLEPDDLSHDHLKKIEQSSYELATEIGYCVMSPKRAEKIDEAYHFNTVWPFEQAIIHAAAKKFGMCDIADIAKRIYPYIQEKPAEVFIYKDHEWRSLHCDTQLWTIAASCYFSHEL